MSKALYFPYFCLPKNNKPPAIRRKTQRIQKLENPKRLKTSCKNKETQIAILRRRMNSLYESRELTVPLSAFTNGTTSKLAGLFCALSFIYVLDVKQGSCEDQFSIYRFKKCSASKTFGGDRVEI